MTEKRFYCVNCQSDFMADRQTNWRGKPPRCLPCDVKAESANTARKVRELIALEAKMYGKTERINP